jgi:hypothetical protein
MRQDGLQYPVDPQELGEFWEKVHGMAREQFGTCDEGKINKVKVILIDRSRFEAFHYFPIPYSDPARVTTEVEYDKITDTLLSNLRMATEALTTHIQCKKYHRFTGDKKKQEANNGGSKLSGSQS